LSLFYTSSINYLTSARIRQYEVVVETPAEFTCYEVSNMARASERGPLLILAACSCHPAYFLVFVLWLGATISGSDFWIFRCGN
jgi:hypothetical protein